MSHHCVSLKLCSLVVAAISVFDKMRQTRCWHIFFVSENGQRITLFSILLQQNATSIHLSFTSRKGCFVLNAIHLGQSSVKVALHYFLFAVSGSENTHWLSTFHINCIFSVDVFLFFSTGYTLSYL